MGETKITTLEKTIDGDKVTIARKVEETLTVMDVIQKKNQLQFQMVDVKRQMTMLKKKHDELSAGVMECDELIHDLQGNVPVIE